MRTWNRSRACGPNIGPMDDFQSIEVGHGTFADSISAWPTSQSQIIRLKDSVCIIQKVVHRSFIATTNTK